MTTILTTTVYEINLLKFKYKHHNPFKPKKRG